MAAGKCEEDRIRLFANCEVMKIKLQALEERIESINTLDGQKKGKQS